MSENRFIAAVKTATKKLKFVGQDLEITKLTVGQVLDIQDVAKEVEANKEKSDAHIGMLFKVIRMGAPELADLDDDELKSLPMDELSDLSNEIMKYSGLGKK